jgi:hypothetical protein
MRTKWLEMQWQCGILLLTNQSQTICMCVFKHRNQLIILMKFSMNVLSLYTVLTS